MSNTIIDRKDLQSEYEIEVDSFCIKLGKPKDPWRCAVAIAIVRHIKGYDPRKEIRPEYRRATALVCIKPRTIAILDTLGWENHEYRTPPEVRKFIEDFDNGRPVSPFKFKMEAMVY